jgi:Protein of unknown function (DUF2510)
VTIEVELARTRYRAGEELSGRVLVHERGEVRSLEVTVRYAEHSTDFGHTWVELRSGSLHAGDLPAGAAVPFAIALPPQALPECVSPFGELAWEVEARADVPGGRDAHHSVAIDVEPPGPDGAALVPPEGWYPDPSGEARLRWWSGTDWTGHVA